MVVFSHLLPALASAYGLQAILAAVSVPLQTGKFYDLGGVLGVVTTTFLSLYYPALSSRYFQNSPNGVLPGLNSFAPRQLLITAALGIWSARLGSILVVRALKAKADGRFRHIKREPARFTALWLVQATWVFIIGLPVYLLNTLPPGFHPALKWMDYGALGLYASGLLCEIIADRQKSAWRRARERGEHNQQFISSGLWSLSRHPNHVGEVGVWTGIWALSLGSLQTSFSPRYMPAVALASPLLTYVLLSRVFDVERQAESRFGDDPRWKNYKATVSVFFPWL